MALITLYATIKLLVEYDETKNPDKEELISLIYAEADYAVTLPIEDLEIVDTKFVDLEE